MLTSILSKIFSENVRLGIDNSQKIVAFLRARAKAALIQPQSEREAVLTGREPPQGNEDDLREPQGCEAPVQTVPAIVRFVPETTSVFSVGQS